MADLVYSALVSLDGYTVDSNGSFEWAAPGDDVHAYVNDLIRPVGTYLYGRRMYEVMQYWETAGTDDDPGVEADFARVWRAADKVVYSTTLTAVASARTRIEPTFDADAVRRLKESSTTDLAVGGPTLAAHAFRAGLVDDVQLFVFPVVVGGGTRALPDGVRLDLTLVDERRFDDGVVHLRHHVLSASV